MHCSLSLANYGLMPWMCMPCRQSTYLIFGLPLWYMVPITSIGVPSVNVWLHIKKSIRFSSLHSITICPYNDICFSVSTQLMGVTFAFPLMHGWFNIEYNEETAFLKRNIVYDCVHISDQCCNMYTNINKPQSRMAIQAHSVGTTVIPRGQHEAWTSWCMKHLFASHGDGWSATVPLDWPRHTPLHRHATLRDSRDARVRALMPIAPIQPVSVGVFAHTRGGRGQWILASVSEHGGREEWSSTTGVVDAGKPTEFIAIIAEPRSASCDLISRCAQIKRVSRPDTR